MMQLTFSPIRSDASLTLSRTGDMLCVNGVALDFAALPEGATLPSAAVDSPWIIGDVTRLDGVLHIALLLPHGADMSDDIRFPAPIALSGDGPVTLPAHGAASATPEDAA